MKAFHFLATMIVAGAGLAACDPGNSDTGVDSAGVPCGDKVCDPHAVCSISSAGSQCQCGPDYVGDGLTCSPLNAPKTCAEVKAASASPADGPATLYVDGDPNKPWTAWCAGMTGTDAPIEYLDVANDAMPSNMFSNESLFIEVSGTAPTQATGYDRVRVDPTTMSIDITDHTFPKSTGAATATPTMLPGVSTISSLPFATVMKCTPPTVLNSQPISIVVDLAGTPFHLTSGQFCVSNNLPGTAANPSNAGKHWDLKADAAPGACGYVMPAPCTFPPVNGNAGAARWLKLTYDE